GRFALCRKVRQALLFTLSPRRASPLPLTNPTRGKYQIVRTSKTPIPPIPPVSLPSSPTSLRLHLKFPISNFKLPYTTPAPSIAGPEAIHETRPHLFVLNPRRGNDVRNPHSPRPTPAHTP